MVSKMLGSVMFVTGNIDRYLVNTDTDTETDTQPTLTELCLTFLEAYLFIYLFIHSFECNKLVKEDIMTFTSPLSKLKNLNTLGWESLEGPAFKFHKQ